MATPGQYTAELYQKENGMMNMVAGPITITVRKLRDGALPAKPTQEIDAFRQSFQSFQQDLMATSTTLKKSKDMVGAMKRAYAQATAPSNELLQRIQAAEKAIMKVDEVMNGNPAKNEIGERNPPSPGDGAFLGYVALGNTYGPTGNQLQAFNRAKQQLQSVKGELTTIVNGTLPGIEAALKAAGAPWIEGQGLIKN